jgi:glycosyltransferase involved in cell wall biosynthesis
VNNSSDKLDWPRVSIVTPSYNQGRFIEETIVSVLEQDYPNLEYIVIDGGSTDETPDIIARYQDKIHYWVSEPDRGQSHALNKGFAQATGDIVAWLNSDDIYIKNSVGSAVRNMMSSGAHIVYSRAKLTTASGEFIRMYEPPEELVFRDMLFMWRHDFVCPPQPSVFMRRQVLDKLGGIDESLDYAMDYDLWLRAIQEYPFNFVDDVWSEYRVHNHSKTGQGFEPFLNEIVRIGKRYTSQLGFIDGLLYRYFGERALFGKYYLDLAYEASRSNERDLARAHMLRALSKNPLLLLHNRGIVKFVYSLAVGGHTKSKVN